MKCTEKRFYFVNFVYIFVFSVHDCRDESPQRCKANAPLGAGRRRRRPRRVCPDHLRGNGAAAGMGRGSESVSCRFPPTFSLFRSCGSLPSASGSTGFLVKFFVQNGIKQFEKSDVLQFLLGSLGKVQNQSGPGFLSSEPQSPNTQAWFPPRVVTTAQKRQKECPR